MSTILIVDHDAMSRASLSAELSHHGFQCVEAADAEQALSLVQERDFNAVITDIEMPGMNGLELMEAANRMRPRLAFIVMTAYASVDTAIEALRKGAYDYLLKPVIWHDLAAKVKKLLEHKELVVENQALRQEINSQYHFSTIVGQSAAIRQVFEIIKKISDSDSNVLISGNSGTGKELVARAIHFNSPRSRGRFVVVNCGAISETLFESELFGHKRGAFTGAFADKDGLFMAADQGTLFLDEISEMALAAQTKLLRAIEAKEITPVGSTESVRVNVRILAATNQDLAERISAGRFRDDLFYRLNVIALHLPSLNERRDDIPLLVRHFVEKYNRQMNKKIRGVDPQLMQYLLQKEWKGEVRELENTIERLMILSQGPLIGLEALPAEPGIYGSFPLRPARASTLKKAKDFFERQFILEQLKQHHYHRGKTARALGIGEATLYRKMNHLNIRIDGKDTWTIRP